MILVDIYVPLMGKTYDFSVDETARISVLVEEICEIICQRERWPRPEQGTGMVLCSLGNRQVLPMDSTLAGMGITSGQRLMLV